MNIGEVGVGLNLWTQFDMSGVGATFDLDVTSPSGVAKNFTPSLVASEVTVPDDVYDEETGLPMEDFPANESVQYVTAADDFDEAGIWEAVVTYTQGGNILRSNPILIDVGE